jgi:hypothetical protein
MLAFGCIEVEYAGGCYHIIVDVGNSLIVYKSVVIAGSCSSYFVRV